MGTVYETDYTRTYCIACNVGYGLFVSNMGKVDKGKWRPEKQYNAPSPDPSPDRFGCFGSHYL